jgi:hypothetical protein
MVFEPLDPNLVTGLTEKRLQRCRLSALVRRGRIQDALHLASGDLLDQFENGIRAYSELVSKIECEFARRAVEGVFDGAR